MSANGSGQLPLVEARLRNQCLVGPPLPTPDAVVQWFGAVQSQEYLSASWGVAQRTHALTQAAIDAAYAAGSILRTHVLRPTWHFFHPADIRWLLQLTAPRVHAVNASFYRTLRLDTATLSRAFDVITGALHGGQHLTRNELGSTLTEAGVLRPDDDRLRLTYLVMYAELEGLICSGRMRGKQHTYALLDERVPPAPALTREAALAELVRRYVTSHGPATIKDFTWWSGLTSADAKAGLAMNPALETAQIDGQPYWFAPGATTEPPASPVAHLLPAYDEYTVAYKDHRAILDAAYRGRLVAAFGIVIVINGRIVGTWKRVLTKRRVAVTLTPFTALDEAAREAIAGATDRYGAFLELPVERVEAAP